MTNPTPRRAIVRLIASSLAFDADPPFIKSLGNARSAGEHIVTALVDAGIVEVTDDEPATAAATNGAAGSHQDDATIPAFDA